MLEEEEYPELWDNVEILLVMLEKRKLKLGFLDGVRGVFGVLGVLGRYGSGDDGPDSGVGGTEWSSLSTRTL